MAYGIEQRNAIIAILGLALSGCYTAPQAYLDSPTIPPIGDQPLKSEASLARLSPPVGAITAPTAPPLILVSDEGPIPVSSAKGELTSTDHVASAEQMSASLESNPDIARWAQEMVKREAVLDLEHAKAIPDLTLTAGVRRVEGSDDTGAVLQFSVPLPVFNRNQGDIAAAQARLLKAHHEGLAVKVEVNAVFLDAYSRLVATSKRLKALEYEVLPSEQEIYDATSKGYLAGGYDLLNVLDAQKTVYATRLEIVNARAEFQKAKVQIEALTGRGLDQS